MSKTDDAIGSADAAIEKLEKKVTSGKGDHLDGAELNRLRIKKQDLQIRRHKQELARIARMPK